MSESSEPSDEYILGSPSPATRRDLPFLDMKLPSPDGNSLSSSLLPEIETPSRFTLSERSSEPGDPFPFTSTPELCFAVSSSPYLSPAKDSPFPHYAGTHLPGVGDAHPVNPASDSASFVHHLDILLREVVEQQNILEIGGNTRIYTEQVLNCKPQLISTVRDTSSDLESVVVPKTRGSRSFPLLHRDLWQLSSPGGGGPGGCVFAVTSSHDASYIPTRNKRKALATIEEDFNIAVDGFTLPCRSDSYLSASDCASPLTRRCSDTHYLRLKKQKCRSFDRTPLPGIPERSPLASSSTLSKTNVFLHKSSSFPRWKERGSNIDEVTTPSDIRYITGLVSPYPPTQLATRVSSPVPILSPRHFQEIVIPRVSASSEDAAEARLKFLLRKDVLYLQRKCSGVLVALSFAPRDSFIMEVIAWILTVEPSQGSTMTVSAEERVHSRDLHDQLTTYQDTRFLAALIFISFFFPASAIPGEENPEVADHPDVNQREEFDDSRKMIVWDYAVAAIALAFHRDNLPPLKPIYARHFLVMAPHEMSFDDLEISQRDLLECLSYDLGMLTPQAILDELRLALPALRHVLHFERAWEDVLSETWKQLLAAAHYILRFPMSLLTAAALIEAITGVVCRHLSLVKLRTRAECLDCICGCHAKRAMSDNRKAPFLEEKPIDEESRILHATSGLFEDIRTVLGLSADKVGECEEWLATVRLVSRQPLLSKYFPAVPE
ncbi:hypothetical protein H4582DRAFT_2142468 [Lactarius indigo]|nr:hypothetical protein H4582DRAFT_2142468 [Lactarius indigo]